MKRTLLFAFLFLTFLSCFSQAIEETPMSWQLSLRSNVDVIELPPLDLEEIIQQDIINDLDKSLPWRYGIPRTVELDMNQGGEWTEIPNVLKPPMRHPSEHQYIQSHYCLDNGSY